jgi:hypothetical protein|tara:strand:- start:42 stop:833 length:792 start_codon:yes stop_codon:yes gene_type:complete
VKNKKWIFLISSGLIFLIIIYYAVSEDFNESEKIDFLSDKNEASVFFDFNGEDVMNSEITKCGKNCNGIEKNVSFVKDFDGLATKFESQNESWITIPHDPSLSFGEVNGATIAFFVKVDSHSHKHNMVYNKGDVGWGYFYNPSYDGLYEGEYRAFQALWTGDNGKEYANVMCDDGKEIELNKWYFVTHVLESEHKTLKQYINGIEYCSDTSEQPLNTDSFDDLNLGHVEGTYNDFGHLTLDNFIIFNRSLNADEILELYQKLS